MPGEGGWMQPYILTKKSREWIFLFKNSGDFGLLTETF